ncbi:cyclase family protein [Pseudomonas nitroreducens]|uniref:cyclase family protein n=1 Tax=Pseudomonas nitroreducens TaxID=46680 RepID=UPI000464A47C|nr:cyclase family protein [Pseudomonas nitroreducens]
MQRRPTLLFAATLLPFLALSAHAAQPGLWDTYASLRQHDWVDLTHAFDSNTPHWKGFEPMGRKTLYTVDKDGFQVELYSHVGQWGTHVDPPVHFHKGLRSVDQLDVKEQFLPLVVFDIHEQVAKNPDYVLTLADVKAWEAKHGPVPEGSFAALRTDWSERWPDQAKMQNQDAKGVAHYPGWSKEALVYLYETRKITASGHETTDTDPGIATSKDDYSLESYILGTNHYQIELLANLDKVPEAGALAVVSFPKIAQGTGFPARVFAILP